MPGLVDWDAFLWGDDWRTANPDKRLFRDPATVLPSMAADVQDAAGAVTTYAETAATNAGQAVASTAANQLATYAPYLAAAGLVWMALQLRRAR